MNWHAIFHVGAVVLQYASIASGIIPPPYGAILAGAVAAIQGGVAVYKSRKAAA